MVSREAVAELRREGEARGLDGINNVLETLGECLGFMVVEMRAMEWGEQEMLDAVEIVARAAQVDRQELRTARDVLRSLSYSPALLKLLTALARRAKPPPVHWVPRGNPNGTEPVAAAAAPSSPQPSEADLAVRLLRPKRRGRR